MGKLTTFGYGSNQYDFSNSAIHQERINSNFGNLVRTSQRMVMSSGGFDRYGISKSPNEVGQVTLQATLRSATRDGMEVLRDNVRSMLRYGLVPLVYQPTDATDSSRFCYARITSINIPQSPSIHTDLHQQVQITWEVPNPVWHVGTDFGALLGVDFILGTSLLGGNPDTITASGTSTDATITNNGNAPALAVITLTTGAGQTCEDTTIQRIVGGTVVDEVSYSGTIGNSKALVINAQTKTVTLDAVNSFNSSFDFTHPSWLRILPGDNTIRVVFANGGDEATVKIAYYDNYYGA